MDIYRRNIPYFCSIVNCMFPVRLCKCLRLQKYLYVTFGCQDVGLLLSHKEDHRSVRSLLRRDD